MNKLAQMFARFSPRERRLIIAALVIIVVYVVYVYIAEPLMAKYDDMVQSKQTQLEILEKYQAILAKEAAYSRKKAESEAMKRQINAGLLTGKSPEIATANLQSLVKDFARELDISLERITISPAKPLDGYTEVGIKLPFTCRISELGDFIYRIESADRLLFIPALDIRVANPREPDTLRVSMDIVGFILSPEGAAMAADEAVATPAAADAEPPADPTGEEVAPDSLEEEESIDDLMKSVEEMEKTKNGEGGE
ncbi:type II secretion system protein M [bacterium]|nr:type II secretion system protein M [candidate division CSSED10-310 bacterium]